MAWPSFPLFISVVGFAFAAAGALYLQFSDRRAPGTVPGVLISLALGIASVSIFLAQADVAEDDDKRPILLSIFSRD